MDSKMNIKKAITILRRKGYILEKSDDKWLLWFPKYNKKDGWLLDDRELINHARTYTSEDQKTSVKKNLKEAQHRQNRAKTRDKIDNEDYDFVKNKPVVKQDIWNFD